MTTKMTFSKSTKNTHVYCADSDEYAIATVYIEKAKLPNPPPQHITVTVEATANG